MKESFGAPSLNPDGKKKSLLPKFLRNLGTASTIATAVASESAAQQQPSHTPPAVESSAGVPKTNEGVKIVEGKKYVALTDAPNVLVGTLNAGSDVSAVFQHNLKKPRPLGEYLQNPRSLAEIGKMLVEPMSVSLSFPYGKDNMVAITKSFFGLKTGEPQIVDIEIPYRYAQKFDKANPQNEERMREQATEDAKKLFDKILTSIYGVSFFKQEASGHHRDFTPPITEVSAMDVTGYASPESSDGINTKDPRNQSLSRLRAENAAQTIQELFKSEGIGVNNVSFAGKGEVALSQDELQKLSEQATILDLTGPKSDVEARALQIIERYNNGSLKEEGAVKLLEEVVGSKRKVAIHLELDQQKKIIIIPVPLLLMLMVPILQRIRREPNQKMDGLPHSFIRSEDPSRPTQVTRTLNAATPGSATYEPFHYETEERQAVEARRFFSRYDPDKDSFFIVSSNDPNDLETANAYRLVAQARKLEVIKPEHTRNDSDYLGGGYTRVINNLSVDPEKSPQELYAREFKNLIKLLNFGERKIGEAKDREPGRIHKKIHILAFGQNKTVQEALIKYFKRYNMDNLEVLGMAGSRDPKKSEQARAKLRKKTKKVK